VVADIRRALFDRVLGMSPAFFERILTGEVLSRITTDTTLILSVIGSSVSVALRNVLMLFGGLVLLFLTSAKLTGLVLLDRAGHRGADHRAWPAVARLSRETRTGSPEFLGHGVRGAVLGPDGAGLHA
jgi:ABC-type multidrug transport system fused ATPase/permease subunit